MIPFHNCVRKEVFDWKEEVYQDIEYAERWVNSLIVQKFEQSPTRKEYCEICGGNDILELHHIAGEKHDDRTLTVCLKCHHWLSGQQKTWDKRWWHDGQPEIVRRMFFLMGLRDVLRLKAMRCYDSSYDSLANKFNEHISKILKEE